MPFYLLKQIISNLRKAAACPNCRRRFDEEEAFILATGPCGPDAYSSLFFVVCDGCRFESFIFSEIVLNTGKNKKQRIYVETKPAGISEDGIHVNEVLDMHNFLKTWQGDVKELFS